MTNMLYGGEEPIIERDRHHTLPLVHAYMSISLIVPCRASPSTTIAPNK